MSNENARLAAELGAVLKAQKLTFCAAESCTGGLLLSQMTDISGSSAYILGGVVTYSNETKHRLIGVRNETLMTVGAVSEDCAREMAVGVRGLLVADIGVSVTGIAGPGGGTPDKPVGLVYIGVANSEGVKVGRYVWDGDRETNKRLSVAQAMRMVLDIL